ncbi:MAG: desulfoferrodoxin family protein [Bacilli bacterium]
MIELVPNSIEASIEKHLPVVTILNDKITIKIGVVEHPMINDYFIEWIIINRKNGYNIKYLNPFDKPEATFYYDNDVVSVYAYCNIHGLWEYKL